MRAQRIREGESRVEMQIVKWPAEGAVKSVYALSILRRVDIRQLSEICWYLMSALDL